MSNPVPEYTVQITDELKAFIAEWPKERQEIFLILAEQLGSTCVTRSERHGGGRASWIGVGNFHMTYTADYHTKVITVTDGIPCTHAANECHSNPRSPSYTGGASA
jgi:hypothetical protein